MSCRNRNRLAECMATFLFVAVLTRPLLAAPNNWTNTTDGFWHSSTNWSLAAAPNGTSGLDPTQIANAATKTITIDASTPAANLSIRSMTISAPAGATNTLRIINAAATFATSKALLVTNRGVLSISNSTISAGSDFDIAGGSLVVDSGSLTCAANCDLQSGSMIVNGGTVTATAGTTGIRMGRFAGANATFTLTGGAVNATRLTLGSVTGTSSTLNIAGGALNLLSDFSAGQIQFTTANASISSGSLTATNGFSKIADRANATFTQSGGTVSFGDLSLGDLGVGTYNLGGGVFNMIPFTTSNLFIVANMENADFNQSGGIALIHEEMHVADFAGVFGNINITGGQFYATNEIVSIGREGIGTMTVSNATIVLTNTSVGRHLGANGTLTVQNNASLSFVGDLSIGRLAGSSGLTQIEGGILSVTNDDLWIGRGGSGELAVVGGNLRGGRIHVGESDDGTNAPSGTFSITAGNVIASSNLVVGTPLLSSGQATISGGNVSVTNLAGSAFVLVASGSATMNGGTLTADTLLINNTNATFTFNNGLLRAKAMTVSNGQPFTVGDGVNPATLELQGGTFNFANGLVISPNATVTGCGNVIGTIVNNGTYNNSCGGSSPSPTTIAAMNVIGNSATLSCASQNGFSYTLEYKNSLNDPAWTPILPATPGNGGTLNLTDATATNATRFYRVKAQ
ncbi:MAG: hypothetical protein HOP33_06185 [Verrucomicrobia bacterium]|nr:hypothetical protein [Verrucomicrobiota bacterium]